MEDNTELTNVPDYQKIMQTSQSAGGQGLASGHNLANWNDSLEALAPSPVVHHPLPSSAGRLEQQHGKYTTEVWDKHVLSSTKGFLDTNRATWGSPSQYDASKYSIIVDSAGEPALKHEPSYIPQGYTRPVSKYVDANGVERRVIRRSFSPNRKSYTEGLLLKDETVLSAGGGFRTVLNPKNLHHNYSSPALALSRNVGNYADGDNSLQPGIIKSSFMTKSMEYLGNGKSQVMGNDQWKDIGDGHILKKSPKDNLRHWQQQHQEELLHQHLETQALYENPSGQPAAHMIEHALGRVSLQDEPETRWEPVRRAADNIIREKNMIIDKLKNRILELEEDFKISEGKLRHAVVSKGDDVDIVKQKLQEVQHKNAVLKEQLNEERAKKNSEIDDLEMKLGSAEYEVQQLKEILRNKDFGVSDIQSQLAEKSKEAEAWQQKFNEACSSHKDMKKRLDGLQRYLDELPTVEESRLQAQQILSLREENVALKAKSESQEKKLIQARKIITGRDFRVRELEEQQQDLEKKIKELQLEIDRLRDGEGSELYNTQKSLKDAKADKERLAIDLEKAKKLLETTHVKLRQQEIKHQSELRAAQERLTLEEQNVVSLRAEVASKEEHIEKMSRSLKELGVRNQELLEQCLLVKEQLRHMEGKSADISTALQRRFMLNLKLCFSELQALVQVCSQCARGENPDMSLLLGVTSPGSDLLQECAGGVGQAESSDPAKTISHWLSQIEQLRKDVDRLRAHICNKYAEDMGNNITCATQ
ncbi:unnamed protein product [Candidula unifasciata]|uniref:Centrosomal protein of 85 kDa-like CC4 coiled-coil domain-containing protein n=1 Tax=Candidula unifasciata TaxID=100452 RepID=A0A8S3YR84_9EUPU|nr:unnamed protein product [Candidula unifasciata]